MVEKQIGKKERKVGGGGKSWRGGQRQSSGGFETNVVAVFFSNLGSIRFDFQSIRPDPGY